MDKKKKIILISIIAIVVIIIIAGALWYFVSNKNTKQDTSKTNQLYDTLKTKTSYSFATILDDNNKMYYVKQDNKAYVDTIYNGNESKFIIKDGNSYLLVEDTNSYYTYMNNETDLNKIELALEELKDIQYETGEEEIEDKKYQYEEYKTITSFTMEDTSKIEEAQEVKTRFYFKGNKLAYIKTIIGDKQELLKVDISYNVDSNLFKIPSTYQKK